MKTKFYLEDFPSKKVYILMEEKFRKAFLREFLSYFSNKKNEALIKAGKWLEVTDMTIWNWEYGPRKNRKNYMPLWACFKISEFLSNKRNKNFSIKEIEKRIICYRGKCQNNTVTTPKFPICFETEEGAIVIAALLCDGGISSDGIPLYNNSELCMREKVVNAFNKLFGKIKTDASNPYQNNAIIFPKVITDILVHTLSMQIGDKVTNNPKIPELFFRSNNEKVIGAFLNQAFSDDGTAYITKCNGQGAVAFGLTVDVTKFSEKFRKQIRKEKLVEHAPVAVKGCKILLEKLGMKVNGPYLKKEYKRKEGIAHSWSIQIQGKENIEKFRNKVNFSIPRKSKKLDDIINNYKEVSYRKSFEDAWRIVTEINNQNQIMNTKTFMKKRKCTLENARFLLKWLRKRGIITRTGGGHKKGIHSCTPFEYKLLKSLKENYQKKMRLFVAVEIPENIKDDLIKIQDKIGNDLAKVKWVNKNQIHLTLKFLGEVEDSKVDLIKERLQNIKVGQFTAAVSQIGFFPPESYIQVIWAGFKENKEIIGLQQKVELSLKDLFKEGKRFHPHITLARVKFVKDKENIIRKLKEIKVEEKTFEVKNFKLIKSTLKPEGPVYEDLCVFS